MLCWRLPGGLTFLSVQLSSQGQALRWARPLGCPRGWAVVRDRLCSADTASPKQEPSTHPTRCGPSLDKSLLSSECCGAAPWGMQWGHGVAWEVAAVGAGMGWAATAAAGGTDLRHKGRLGEREGDLSLG